MSNPGIRDRPPQLAPVRGGELASRATFVHGMRVSLLIAAAVALAAAAVSILLRPAGNSSQ